MHHLCRRQGLAQPYQALETLLLRFELGSEGWGKCASRFEAALPHTENLAEAGTEIVLYCTVAHQRCAERVNSVLFYDNALPTAAEQRLRDVLLNKLSQRATSTGKYSARNGIVSPRENKVCAFCIYGVNTVVTTYVFGSEGRSCSEKNKIPSRNMQ